MKIITTIKRVLKNVLYNFITIDYSEALQNAKPEE